MRMLEKLIPFPSFLLVGMDDLQRFWAKFDRKGPNECWLWIGASYSDGLGKGHYGAFKLLGEQYPAHRVSYFFHHREDPGQLFVCHACNVRPCVNPRHLVLGTQSENIQYAFDCGRMTNKGQFHSQALFDDSEIRFIRSSSERNCDIAKRFGCSPKTISEIRRWNTYK